MKYVLLAVLLVGIVSGAETIVESEVVGVQGYAGFVHNSGADKFVGNEVGGFSSQQYMRGVDWELGLSVPGREDWLVLEFDFDSYLTQVNSYIFDGETGYWLNLNSNGAYERLDFEIDHANNVVRLFVTPRFIVDGMVWFVFDRTSFFYFDGVSANYESSYIRYNVGDEVVVPVVVGLDHPNVLRFCTWRLQDSGVEAEFMGGSFECPSNGTVHVLGSGSARFYGRVDYADYSQAVSPDDVVWLEPTVLEEEFRVGVSQSFVDGVRVGLLGRVRGVLCGLFGLFC